MLFLLIRFRKRIKPFDSIIYLFVASSLTAVNAVPAEFA
jgi:hypothetical protein